MHATESGDREVTALARHASITLAARVYQDGPARLSPGMRSSLVGRVARRLALVAAMAATAVVLALSGTGTASLLGAAVAGSAAATR